MAVTYDNSAQGIQTATASVVVSLAVTPGACLVVGISTSSNVSISACYANGTQLTQLGRALHDSNTMAVCLFGYTAPPSGTVSISANTVAAAQSTIGIHAASYVGGVFGTDVFIGSASNVTACNLTFSTSTTDMMVLFGASRQTLQILNGTTRQTDNQHLAVRLADTAGSASSFIFSMSGNNASATNYIYIGTNITPPSVALSRRMLTLLGVT